MTSLETSAESSAEYININDSCIESSLADGETIMKFVGRVDVGFLSLCIISTFFQISVIRHALQNLRRGNGDQCLHVFLLSMTIGDLMLTGFCYPIEYGLRMTDYKLHRWLNIITHITTWVGLSASSISLVFLNLEKLLYFKYPLRYSSYVTRRKGVIAAVTIWLSCIVFVLAAWYFQCFQCDNWNCQTIRLLEGRRVMYLLFSVSVCIVPTLTSLIVAIYILKVVSSHRKKLAEEQALYTAASPHSTSHAIASRLRTFYFIFMTTVFTAATLLPLRLYHLKDKFFGPETAFMERSTCLSYIWLWIMYYLIATNAVLNPFITVTVLPQYRFRFINKFLGIETSDHKATEV